MNGRQRACLRYIIVLYFFIIPTSYCIAFHLIYWASICRNDFVRGLSLRTLPLNDSFVLL